MPHFSCCWMPSPLQAHWGRWCHTYLLHYLQFAWGSAPPPLSRAQGAPPFLLRACFFFSCLFIIQVSFFLFSLSRGQSVQGTMLICPREYCVPLSSPSGLLLPSRLGAGVWQHGSPPGFSIYHWVGMLCVGWRCGGVRVLPLLGGFSCKVYLQCLSKSLL
jgi:hypothetical protein